MGIGFGSGILLDLVLFADRTKAEPQSKRSTSILWDMEGLQRFERRVCIFLAVCFKILECIARASPTGGSGTAT